MSLHRRFSGDFAKKAFQTIDGEQRIVGKWGEITLSESGIYDVWIVKPDRNPLGTRKLNNIISAITATSWEADIHILDGEAWFTTREPDFIPEIAPQLGIPKRRAYSEATLERMREQAAKNLGGAL